MTQLPYLTALFPLPETVFMPKTTIPLNIFEKRYLTMLEDCLRNDMPLGLCPSFLADREDFEGVTCTIGKPIVIQENMDGSKLIMVHATEKVTLHQRLQSIPYQKYNCILTTESNRVDSINLFRVNRVKIELKKWFERNSQSHQEETHFIDRITNKSQLINYGCHFLIQEAYKKQVLLEMNSINDRLDKLLFYLEQQTELNPSII